MDNGNFEKFIGQRNIGKRKQSEIPQELGRVNFATPIFFDVEAVARENFPHGKYLKTADEKSEYILDENGRTVLLFERGKSKKGFASIYTPLSQQDLRREILCLPDEQQEAIAQALGLPEPTPEDIKTFREKQAQRAREKAVLEKTLSLPKGFKEGTKRNIDQELVRGILQKEYAITDATSEKPIIGTFGLGTCIALTVYDSKRRVGAIAHIDATTAIDSLDRIFYDLQESGVQINQQLIVGLIGGDSSSRQLVVSLLDFLRNKSMSLSFADILDKPHPSTFVMDTKTGEIVPNIHPTDCGEEEDLRMKVAGLQMQAQIKKEFDGRAKRQS